MTWLPNALSLSRIPIAFTLIIIYRLDDASLQLALWLFVIAAVTDKLDGCVARCLHVASTRGYLVDGFADRTLSVACILVAAIHHELALWVVLLAVTREFLLYTSRLIAPDTWHPPSRARRLHSLIIFSVTRLWFLALIILALFTSPEVASRGARILNALYAVVVLTSSLLLSEVLFRRVATCFEDECF